MGKYVRDLFAVVGPRTVEQLRRGLAERSGQRLELTLTQNRVTMASVRFVGERHARVRLHEAFLEAPAAVQDALAGYLRSRRKRHWQTVCAYARTISVGAGTQRVQRVGTGRGQVYHLGQLAKEVNQQHFRGGLRFQVAWGRRVTAQRRRSIRYGSCNRDTGLIRIHPLLDDATVPEGFLRYILFHEMLHLAVPPEYTHGRRSDHGATFRRFERRYPDFAQYKQMARTLFVRLAAEE